MSTTKSSYRSCKTSKITVNSRNFYWFVAMDENAPDVICMRALNIISEDRQFMVRYHLNQRDHDTRQITVLGPEFGGKKAHQPVISRYLAPAWAPEASFTKRQIIRLISWCMSGKSKRIEIDINGNRAPARSFWDKLLSEPSRENKWSQNWRNALATAGGLSGLFFSS